jgi:TetR/AcrR family transcriptional regulator
MGQKRAITEEERAARRRQILNASAFLLERWSLDDVNVDRIADLAGVAKGTVYIYFRTREELVLEVFDLHHGVWLDALEAALRGLAGPLTPDEVGRMTVSTLLGTPLLFRLYGRINALYYGSVSAEAAHRFRMRQAQRIASIADALAGRLPDLTTARAERWLFRFEAYVAGIVPLAHLPRIIAETPDRPGAPPFDVDLEVELQYVAVTMLLSP